MYICLATPRSKVPKFLFNVGKHEVEHFLTGRRFVPCQNREDIEFLENIPVPLRLEQRVVRVNLQVSVLGYAASVLVRYPSRAVSVDDAAPPSTDRYGGL